MDLSEFNSQVCINICTDQFIGLQTLIGIVAPIAREYDQFWSEKPYSNTTYFYSYWKSYDHTKIDI